MTLEQAGRALGVTTSRVRQLIRDRELVAVRPAGQGEPLVPALFLQHGQVVKGLAGTLTLLHDAGYRPDEAVGWLFTADDSLPGRPIDRLRENRGTEVRRRAHALGF